MPEVSAQNSDLQLLCRGPAPEPRRHSPSHSTPANSTSRSFKMVYSLTLMRSALVAAVLLAVIHFGSADKLASCCKSVSVSRISEPITGYMIQKPHPPCVPAVIIQTETGVYCIHVKAHWLKAKIMAFQKAKREATTISVAPSSTDSLLSIITSTASPTTDSLLSIITSTASPTSFTPTSQIQPDETFGENNAE
uniref:Chemokine interleukin-8-like domain-containing protein n=1 Tax=Takifugu rubripes TaxID=31033 RepID=A0A3B5K533_TAKRU